MKAKGIPPKVRAEVLERSQGLCEIPHGPHIHRADHMHHVLMRSQGGKHTADNLLHVCHSAHLEIHSYPAAAYERGWLKRSGIQ